LGGLASIDLRFDSPSPLPHDINVLIGPNGVGKSQLLRQIVDDWLQLNPDAQAQVGFGERPNLNQVVVVSYSPFELFPVDTSEDKERKDHDVYRYFGFRGRMKALTDSKRGSDGVLHGAVGVKGESRDVADDEAGPVQIKEGIDPPSMNARAQLVYRGVEFLL
jgi:hypothetical protein